MLHPQAFVGYAGQPIKGKGRNGPAVLPFDPSLTRFSLRQQTPAPLAAVSQLNPVCAYVLDCLNVGPIEAGQYESPLNVPPKLWFDDFGLVCDNRGFVACCHSEVVTSINVITAARTITVG